MFYKRLLSIQDLEKIVKLSERIANQPEAKKQRKDAFVLVADDDSFVTLVLDNIL